MSTVIAELKNLVAELKESNRMILERLSNLESGSSSAVAVPATKSDFENSVNQYGRVQREWNDRNSRRANLLIFGLPDTGNDPPDDKRGDADSNPDLKFIRDALTPIQGIDPMTVLSVYRLGAFDVSDAKSRPIKAEFDCVKSKASVMKKLKLFLTNLNVEKAFVRHDLTAYQRQQRKSTVDVLHKIRAEVADEDQKKSYVIRESNGIAKIVHRQSSGPNEPATFADVFVSGALCSPYNIQFDNLNLH